MVINDTAPATINPIEVAFAPVVHNNIMPNANNAPPTIASNVIKAEVILLSSNLLNCIAEVTNNAAPATMQAIPKINDAVLNGDTIINITPIANNIPETAASNVANVWVYDVGSNSLNDCAPVTNVANPTIMVAIAISFGAPMNSIKIPTAKSTPPKNICNVANV